MYYKNVRSVAQLILLNIGLYIVDYGLDIKAYFITKEQKHHKWANSILLATFLPNIVSFFHQCMKTLPYVQKYARHKYEMCYQNNIDWKNMYIYHIYNYYNIIKWKDVPGWKKLWHIFILLLRYSIFSGLICLLIILLILLMPLFLLLWATLELFSVKPTVRITNYLDKKLYGWIIGHNRLADGKTHHKQQRNTHDLLYDLLVKDR